MKLEISEKKTCLVQGKYKKQVETEDFFKTLIPDEIIPVSLRWRDTIRGLYVLEYPPTHQIIYKTRSGDPYKIPLPWQVYICSVYERDVKFFCRTEQLKSLDDDLNHQFMSNIYRSGTPCSGEQGRKFNDTNNPIEICRAMIAAIWMTTFSGGCYISRYGKHSGPAAFKDNGGSLQPKEIVKAGFDSDFWAYSQKNFYGWVEKKTIEEMLSWDWIRAGTVRELIEFTSQNESVWAAVPNTISRAGKVETISE